MPALYWALLDGKTSLGSLSKTCAHLTQANATELLKKVEGKTVRETEKILAAEFPKMEVKDSVRRAVSPLSVDKVHIHFTANTAFELKLQRARELLSHKYPEGALSEILGEALDLLIDKLEKSRKQASCQPNMKRFMPHCPARPFDTRSIPVTIQRKVWQRDGEKCSYVSSTGRKCDSKSFLQLDHIQSWVLGGSSHDPQNLRVLCALHNRLRHDALNKLISTC